MNGIKRRWLRPLLFALGGAVVGLVYYYSAACASGSCSITATPIRSMVYMAFVGWLLSGLFEPRAGSCGRE